MRRLDKKYNLFNFKTIKSYFLFLRWFIADAIWRYRKVTFAVLFAEFLGVTLQVQVLAIIIYYARSFSTGGIISFAGYSFDPRSSLVLLISGSVLVTVLLLFSALCVYFSRQRSLRLTREYTVFSAKRILRILGTEKFIFASGDQSSSDTAYFFKLIRSDSMLAGRLLRMLLSTVIPAVTLVAAVSVLLYLEFILTLSIGVLLIVIIFFQYRVSIKAANFSVQREKLSRLSGKKYKELFSYFGYQYQPLSNLKFVDRIFAAGPVKKQLDAYEGRLKSTAESKLGGDVFMAAVLGLIILVMGISIIQKGAGWERLLVYIVALRFAMSNLQHCFSSLTTVNRYYPQVRRLFLFKQSIAEQDKIAFVQMDQYELHIEDKARKLKGTENRIIFKKAKCLALVTPHKLNRYSMVDMVRALLGESGQILKSALYSSCFAVADQGCPYQSVRRALAMHANEQEHDLKRWFPDEKKWRSFINQLGDISRRIRPNDWNNVTPVDKFIFSLVRAARLECSWVILDAKGLMLLDSASAKFYLDLFQDRFVVIVYNNNLDVVGSFGESSVAVTDEENLLGIGTPAWFSRIKTKIADILLNAEKVTHTTEDVDDELEE